MNLIGAALAGGASRRMGRDKATMLLDSKHSSSWEFAKETGDSGPRPVTWRRERHWLRITQTGLSSASKISKVNCRQSPILCWRAGRPRIVNEDSGKSRSPSGNNY